MKFVKSGAGNLTIRNLTDATGVTLTSSFEGTVRCSGTLTTLFDPTVPPTPPTPLPTILAAVYPVGSTYINTSSNVNPATIFGFGTWVPFAEGRMIVGIGSGTDVNGFARTFAASETGGEYRHTQTTTEVGDHSHRYYYSNYTATGTGYSFSGVQGSGASYATSSSGTATPMQWLSPYVTAYIWTRVA